MHMMVALVRREIWTQRALLVAALLGGLFPVFAPFLPFTDFSADDLRFSIMFAGAVWAAVAAVLGLGIVVLGNELGGKNVGFFLRRPISGWGLWAGKLLGAYVVFMLTMLALVVPTLLLDSSVLRSIDFDFSVAWPLELSTHGAWKNAYRSLLPQAFAPGLVFAAVVLFPLTALAALQLLTNMVRSRSAWIFVDLAGLIGVVTLMVSTVDHLNRWEAFGPLVWLERLVLPAVALLVLVAAGLQVVQGRLDLVRGHRWASLALWPPLLLLTFGGWVWSQWLVRADVDDLDRVDYAVLAPSGPWVAVGGPSGRAGYQPTLLFDTETAATIRLGGPGYDRSQVAFSGNGLVATWTRCHGVRRAPEDCDLYWVDLATGDMTESDIPVRRGARVMLDHVGARLAAIRGSEVALWSLDSHDQIIALNFGREVWMPHRVGTNELRVIEATVPPRLWSVDMVSGARSQIAELDQAQERNLWTATVSPDGSRIAASAGGPPMSIDVYDDTGRRVATWSDVWFNDQSNVAFVGDEVVIAQVMRTFGDRYASQLAVVRADGTSERLFEDAERPIMMLGGEIAPGRLLIGTSTRDPLDRREWLRTAMPFATGYGSWIQPSRNGDFRTYVLDLATGEVELFLDGVLPIVPAIGPVGPGQPASRLMLDEAGRLLRHDPVTG
ncbi:MAG: hypothetical protein AAGD38_22080, partial [Acidobacteriota bacterium]